MSAEPTLELSDEAFLEAQDSVAPGAADEMEAVDDGDQQTFYGDSIFPADEASESEDGEGFELSGDRDGDTDSVVGDEGSDPAADGGEGSETLEATDAVEDEDSELAEEDTDDETESEESPEASAEDDDSEEASEEEDSAAAEFMARITAPFKANGREMKVDNPDDVIRLMQMGANYNRKMSAMKPHLKVLKTLEKNDLLDEQKLNFLIDLDKKNPDAIKQLVKDAKLDVDTFDEESDKTYETPDYQVADAELALDEVVEEIRDTATYSQTLDIVTNQWDSNSRKIVANQPQLMAVINTQVANGIYDRINTEVIRERTLGRLSGMSDIEAYKTVGDALQAQGAFDDISGEVTTDTPSTPKPKANTQPKAKKDTQRKAKRRAASTTKAAPDAPKSDDFNPLGLSDEEYLKQLDDRFV